MTIYFIYVLLTLRASSKLVADGHATEASEPMWMTRLGLPQNMPVIIIQLALGLGLLVAGAKGFIHGVEHAAPIIGISALMLSLMIVPIASSGETGTSNQLTVNAYGAFIVTQVSATQWNAKLLYDYIIDGPGTLAASTGTDAATYTRERPGVSAFALDGGAVYHTYSAYARGLDPLIGTYQFLDLTPFGRGEGWGGMPNLDGKGLGWLRHRDKYETAETASCCHAA